MSKILCKIGWHSFVFTGIYNFVESWQCTKCGKTVYGE